MESPTGRYRARTSRMSLGEDQRGARQVLRIVGALAMLALLTIAVARAWRSLPTQCLGVDQSNILQIRDAIDAYAIDNGRYPMQLSELGALGPDGEPYLRCPTPTPLDPWGNPYVYRPPTATTSYEVTTSGP